MMLAKSLFFVGAFVGRSNGDGAPQVDCSDAQPWTPKVYNGARESEFATVHYEGAKYRQQWWAGENDVPGKNGAWRALGTCVPGTNGGGQVQTSSSSTSSTTAKNNDTPAKPTTKAPTVPGGPTRPTSPSGPTIDCSSYEVWKGSKAYSESGTVAVRKGKAYVSKWWSKGEVPEKSEAWELKGACTQGTEPEETKVANNPELDRILCSCCKECAEPTTSGPVCHTGGECYFTNCKEINSFSEEACKDVTENKKYLYWPRTMKPATAPWPKRVYAPYIDSGLATLMPMSKLAKDYGVKHYVLAFVTGDKSGKCKGAVAGLIDIKTGPTYWDDKAGDNAYLWDEVNALREAGGDVVLSFGGAANTELADVKACQEGDPVKNLVQAYSEVIDFLKLTHIDFDIEGNGISSTHRATGWKYRFQALKALKEKYPAIKVWYTLPILPAGLTLDGINFVTDLMTADAPMDIMNVMNMDYGDMCPSLHMGECEREAMDNLAKQMLDIAQKTGKASKYGWASVQDVYPYLGSTPMIGTNDVTKLIYRVEDARESVKSWVNKPLGMISQWSLHRDRPCPGKQGMVDLDCSSVKDQTEPFQFAKIFNQHSGN